LIYAAFIKPGPLGRLLGPMLAEHRPKNPETQKNKNGEKTKNKQQQTKQTNKNKKH
jgi:hypothetical protein